MGAKINFKSCIVFLLVFCFLTVGLSLLAGASLVRARSGSGGSGPAGLDGIKRLYGRDFEKQIEKAESQAEQIASSGNASSFDNVLAALNKADETIDEIKTKIENWKATGPEADEYLAELKTRYQSAFSSAFEKCEPILVSSLSNKAAPKNVYSVANKAKFQQMIMTAWKEAWPNDKILGLRFPNASFKQTYNEKRWDSDKNSWTLVKKSVLVASMVVQISPKLAAIYPAYINRDDITKELSAGVYTKGSDYIVDLMLVSNFK